MTLGLKYEAVLNIYEYNLSVHDSHDLKMSQPDTCCFNLSALLAGLVIADLTHKPWWLCLT